METDDLKKLGLKVTHPRIRILEILGSDGVHHLSAEDLYRRLLSDGRASRAERQDEDANHT